eukprot:SAG11_NODE_896_length_6641_cov_3.280495_3_plen_122_part_00
MRPELSTVLVTDQQMLSASDKDRDGLISKPEFLDYVLSTEEIDPGTGKYEDSKHEASVLALLNGGVSHLIGSPASGVDDRASESSSEGAVVGEDGAQEDGAQHIPDAGAPPTSGAEASSGQ